MLTLRHPQRNRNANLQGVGRQKADFHEVRFRRQMLLLNFEEFLLRFGILNE